MNEACHFCKRPMTPIANALSGWCSPWCWILDKTAPYRPTPETLERELAKLREAGTPA